MERGNGVQALKIKTEEQYQKAIDHCEALWDSKPGSADHLLLEALVALIHEYEDQQSVTSG